MFSHEIGEKFTHMIVATAICCTAATAAPQLGIVGLVEALLAGGAGAYLYFRQRAGRLDGVVRRCVNQVDKSCDALLEREFRNDPDAARRRDEAVAMIATVLPQIVPQAQELVDAKLDESRVVGFFLDRATRFQPKDFGDEPGNALTRRLFGDVVRNAFRVIAEQPEFSAKVLHHSLAELLQGQERAEEMIDAVAEQVAEIKALLQGNPQVAAAADQYHLSRPVVDGLFIRIGENPPTSPEELPGRFEALAARFASLSQPLAARANDGPEIAALKRQALAALENRVDLDTAERLLVAIRERQADISERRRRAATEASADLIAALVDEADTCARQADAALLRLDVAGATGCYREGLAVLGEAPAWERWGFSFTAAGTLFDFGERAVDNAALLAAITLNLTALIDAPRERVPLIWAMTQGNLGNAQMRLGERESGAVRLEEAVTAYRAALDEQTRERVPVDWATTQNNLGNALLKLGERERGTARLEEAVAAYRAALKERTRERAPLDWAMTQNNLGTALEALGERESGTTRLEEAVAAYRAALEERKRERLPLDWAMTQNNLGTALETLGERESGTTRLEEAVAAYRAALEEQTRERVPLDWAMTQNNLGNALRALGARQPGTARLEEAVSAFRAALEEWTRERVPLDWATTQNNLGIALTTLGERESGRAQLKEAVVAYRAALEERTRERVPLDWAMTQNNLGTALVTLGERESGTARLTEALAAHRAALEERTRERAPFQWAMSQNNLGNALQALGERDGGTARLEEAVAAYDNALSVFEAAGVDHYIEMAQGNRARALAFLEQRR